MWGKNTYISPPGFISCYFSVSFILQPVLFCILLTNFFDMVIIFLGSLMWFRSHKATEIINFLFSIYLCDCLLERVFHLILLRIEEREGGELFVEAAKTICCYPKKKFYSFITCSRRFEKRPVSKRYDIRNTAEINSCSKKMAWDMLFAKLSWTHFQEHSYYIKQPVVNFSFFQFYCWQIMSPLN